MYSKMNEISNWKKNLQMSGVSVKIHAQAKFISKQLDNKTNEILQLVTRYTHSFL